MSANNWTVCPRHCTKPAGPEAVVPAEPQPTFREDYEIYLDGDVVVVDYSGRCTECDAGISFTHGVPLP